MDEIPMTMEELIEGLTDLRGAERLERLMEIVNRRYRAKPSEAFVYAKEGLELAQELGNRELETRFLNRMGISQHFQGKFDEAIIYYQRSADIAQELNKLDEVATNISNVATIMTMRGEYSEALDMLNEISETYIKLGDKPRMAITYNNIANIYLKLNAFDRCIEKYFQALRIREEVDDKIGMISSCGNIGSYLKEEDPERALKYLQRAVDLIEETGEERFRGFVFTQRGITRFLAGDKQGCIDDIEAAIKVMIETENQYDLAMAYDYLAEIYTDRDDFETAMHYRNLALEIARQEKLIDYVSRELHRIARLMLTKGEIDKAQVFLDEAMEIAEKIDKKKYIMHCTGMQAEIFEARGKFREACEAYKRYNDLKEESSVMELTQRAKELEVIYSVEKKEQETELVRQKNDELAKINDDLRKTNLALQEAQDSLRVSERKVTALAMSVTANHQINQPLMVAQGSAELLKMSFGSLTPKQTAHFDKILDSISRIQKLLEKYCKIENIDFEEYIKDTPMVTIS